MPLISVIMPSYNHERFVGAAIDSVLGQSVEDLELIIIDDASRDQSRSIIESYQARDGRIRAFFHPTNQGIARTMNQALEEPRGEFVAFLSSDDLWVQDKLRKQLDVLRQDEDLVVCSEMSVIDAEGKNAGRLKTGEPLRSGRVPGTRLLEKLLDRNCIAGQSMILRRRNLEGLCYDEQLKYLNDWKFCLDLARRYDFFFLPECLAMYRLHGGNSIDRDETGWMADFSAFGQYVLANYAGLLSPAAKAKFLYRIGCDAHFRGQRREARRWMLKAILANPLKTEYTLGLLSSWAGHPVIPRSIRRRVRRQA